MVGFRGKPKGSEPSVEVPKKKTQSYLKKRHSRTDTAISVQAASAIKPSSKQVESC